MSSKRWMDGWVDKLWESQVKAASFQARQLTARNFSHQNNTAREITTEGSSSHLALCIWYSWILEIIFFHKYITQHSSEQYKIWCLYIFCVLMSVQRLLKWSKCGSLRRFRGSREKQSHLTLKEWSQNDDVNLTSHSFTWLGLMNGG